MKTNRFQLAQPWAVKLRGHTQPNCQRSIKNPRPHCCPCGSCRPGKCHSRICGAGVNRYGAEFSSPRSAALTPQSPKRPENTAFCCSSIAVVQASSLRSSRRRPVDSPLGTQTNRWQHLLPPVGGRLRFATPRRLPRFGWPQKESFVLPGSPHRGPRTRIPSKTPRISAIGLHHPTCLSLRYKLICPSSFEDDRRPGPLGATDGKLILPTPYLSRPRGRKWGRRMIRHASERHGNTRAAFAGRTALEFSCW